MMGAGSVVGAGSVMGVKSGFTWRSSGHGSSNLVLMGDALHRTPSLTGQGLNLGIGDAIGLSACLRIIGTWRGHFWLIRIGDHFRE